MDTPTVTTGPPGAADLIARTAACEGPTGHNIMLAGEVDLSKRELVVDAITRAGRQGGPVAVDLSHVTFMDSTGLCALLTAAKEVQVVLSGVSQPVERLLEVAGLTNHFERRQA